MSMLVGYLKLIIVKFVAHNKLLLSICSSSLSIWSSSLLVFSSVGDCIGCCFVSKRASAVHGGVERRSVSEWTRLTAAMVGYCSDPFIVLRYVFIWLL